MKTASQPSAPLIPGLTAGIFALLSILPVPEPASGQELDPALLAGMTARSIGPAGMSGRIAAIDAVEADPNIVYVGAATGGLWKSSMVAPTA